ncbi:N-6 DNA methylase [Streptococcus suis]|uniref:N-6 DNA methylase n=1 Tax=Streptococcus suis TaxID=1307 RepID=UPI0015D4CC3C|nr:N-6 DNA methylase [Streptococcus suis]
MLTKLLSSEQSDLLERIGAIYGDRQLDQFRDFFQEEGADRKKLKQDYTPDGVAELLARVSRSGKSLADICAGTGSLTIQYLNYHPDVEFVRCEEFSARVIPFLLINLAIRKINAEVIHGDSLTREHFNIYAIRDGVIRQIDSPTDRKVDVVISNPPYSMAWTPISDERFDRYGLAPKTKADFAFLLHGFHQLEEDGTMSLILPHGVLFRGNSEGTIRQQLLEHGAIDSIIGLAPNLFLNTGIPVAILLLKKGTSQRDVFFVDAKDEFTKGKAQNSLDVEHIKKIAAVVSLRMTTERFSYLADWEKIVENGYNLNIPRYVDTFVPEEVQPLGLILRELIEIDKEIAETEREFARLFGQLVATDPTEQVELESEQQLMREYVDKPSLSELIQEESEQLTLW